VCVGVGVGYDNDTMGLFPVLGHFCLGWRIDNVRIATRRFTWIQKAHLDQRRCKM
jgi:hypothetical protein